jgi:hypothetical protein
VRLGRCNFLPARTSFLTSQHAILCSKVVVSIGNICAQKLNISGIYFTSYYNKQQYSYHNTVLLAMLTIVVWLSKERTSFYIIIEEGIRGDILLTICIPNIIVDVIVRLPFMDRTILIKNRK